MVPNPSPHRTTILFVFLLILVTLSCNSPALVDPSKEDSQPGSAPETALDDSLFPIPAVTLMPWDEPDFQLPSRPAPEEPQQLEEEQPTGLVIDTQPQVIEQVETSLASPLPAGSVANSPYWELEVLDVLRGEAAYERILQDNGSAAPPPGGMEYVTIQIRLRNKFADEYSHSFDIQDNVIIGDKRLSRKDFLVDVPSPEIVYTDTFVGEELIGWYETLVEIGENNLILAVSMDPGQEEVRTFLAIDENASLPPSPGLSTIQPNDLGLDQDNPAPIGTMAISDEWQVTVQGALRGDEALAFLQQINPSNTGAEEGMEADFLQ